MPSQVHLGPVAEVCGWSGQVKALQSAITSRPGRAPEEIETMVGRNRFRIALSFFACAFFASLPSTAAGDESLWSAERFAGLELRSIGPALMAGRLSPVDAFRSAS